MRFLLFAMLILLIFPASSDAYISSEPDSILLVSDIYDLKIVDDDFAVAITQFGVSSFVLDQPTSSFVFWKEVRLELGSATMKVFGNLVVILEGESVLHFFDAAALPDLTYLGAAELEFPIADYCVVGSHLYITSYFNGIRRYSIENCPDLVFLDADLFGICMTRLELCGDILYALDEYNGLMRYDLSGGGFGVFLDYLYIPRRVYDFARYDLEFYLVFNGGCYLADFSQTPPAIVDSVTDIEPVAEVYASEPYLILVIDHTTLLHERSNLDSYTTINTTNNRNHGDLMELNGDTHLLLPEKEGGATKFNLDEGIVRSSALYREGAITGMLIYDDKLFTCGISMPVDVYDIADRSVSYAYTIFENWDSTFMMTHNGDTLLTLSGTHNTVNFLVNSTDPQTVGLANAFFAPAPVINDLIYLQETVNGQRVVITVETWSADIWAIDDEAVITLANTWHMSGDVIHSTTTRGSTVYIEGFRYPEIRAYTIGAQFEGIFHDAAGLYYHPFKMLPVGDYLYALQWDMIKMIDISDPLNPAQGPTVALPFTAYDACMYGRWMYCVGPDGILVLDLQAQPPVIVDQGGRGGLSLAVGNDILAVNSGDGLHIYQIDTTDFVTWTPSDSLLVPGRFLLSQNYPNPFNVTTTISYSLERRTEVDLSIYNLLGQKVATLVNATQPAGNYNICWDGMTDGGQEAASGVYFYKLATEDFRETRKMLLLK